MKVITGITGRKQDASFHECMRVLKPDGVLIFKWSDISVSTREILDVIGEEPLFGHRSGRKMNTHWMCFMKFDDDERQLSVFE